MLRKVSGLFLAAVTIMAGMLDVYAENQAAIRAYEKAGFKSNLIEMSISLGEKNT